MPTPLEHLDSLGVGHLHQGRRITQAMLAAQIGLRRASLSHPPEYVRLALEWAVELWEGRVPVGVQSHTKARELALRIGRAVAELRGCEVPARVLEGEKLWPEVRS